MIRKAALPALAAFVFASALAGIVAGPGAAVSAGIAIVVVYANFAAHGWSLAWASEISLGAVGAVALGGLVLRMGVIIGLLVALKAFAWFSPPAFALAVVPATLLLLAFEARLAIGGVGAGLQIPADPAAARAGAALASREAS